MINNNPIPQADSVRDLGITVTSDLKWASYISKITSKANILSYNIIRSFSSSNIIVYTNLFKTYIRPILEYNTVVWSPHLVSDIQRVEKVQRRFTKMVCQKTNTKFSSYQDRLNIMNLDTLEIRRVRFDLMFMYKILNNIVDVDQNDLFKINRAAKIYNLRSHNLQVQQDKYSGSNIREHFFTERVIPTWNVLPIKIIESPNINTFKARLSNFNIKKIYASKL